MAIRFGQQITEAPCNPIERSVQLNGVEILNDRCATWIERMQDRSYLIPALSRTGLHSWQPSSTASSLLGQQEQPSLLLRLHPSRHR